MRNDLLKKMEMLEFWNVEHSLVWDAEMLAPYYEEVNSFLLSSGI